LQVGPERAEELLGRVPRDDVPGFVPVHETDDDVLVEVPGFPLDPDEADLVQVDDGVEVAAPFVAPQFKRPWRGSPAMMVPESATASRFPGSAWPDRFSPEERPLDGGCDADGRGYHRRGTLATISPKESGAAPRPVAA
jgi:hypothetical protein